MKNRDKKKVLGRFVFSVLIIVFALGAASCGYNYSGSFRGNAKYEILVYEEPFFHKETKIENLTFTLERDSESKTFYVLKFGENSPVQCTLKVDNRFADREGKGEENEDMNVEGFSKQACKVLDRDGNMKNAHTEKITGTLYGNREIKRNYLEVPLGDGVGGSYRLIFEDGERIK